MMWRTQWLFHRRLRTNNCLNRVDRSVQFFIGAAWVRLQPDFVFIVVEIEHSKGLVKQWSLQALLVVDPLWKLLMTAWVRTVLTLHHYQHPHFLLLRSRRLLRHLTAFVAFASTISLVAKTRREIAEIPAQVCYDHSSCHRPCLHV